MRGEQVLLVLWKRWLARGRIADSPDEAEQAERQVLAIQAGDESLRESFIIQYRPFIAKTASRFGKRYIDPDHDDEFSVALFAFNEAIDHYSQQAGSRFIGFADKVMTRRLIDYARQEQRHASSVPFSAFASDDDADGRYLEQLENAAAMEAYDRDRIAETRSIEIAALSEQLALFGIGFKDLADDSPKHRDSRATLLDIGIRLADTPQLYGRLLEKRQLPMKELCTMTKVSRKTVERNRKYIIAVSLIAGGAYPSLRAYIEPEPVEKEGQR